MKGVFKVQMAKKTDKITGAIEWDEKIYYHFLKIRGYEGKDAVELTKNELIWVKWVERRHDKVQEFLKEKYFEKHEDERGYHD